MGCPGLEPGTNRLKAEYSTIELATPFLTSRPMYTPMHNKFQNRFQLANLTHSHSFSHSWLLAISGGQDSLCLLKFMHDLVHHHLVVVHFDHRWSCSLAALRVYYLSRYMHLAWRYFRTALPITTEQDARQYRYANLIQLLYQTHSHAICTAHTASDDLETYLDQWISLRHPEGIWRLCHLSGSQILFRPLLHLTRAQTHWFTLVHYLPIWSDVSNYQITFKRNQLRHQLIPFLKNLNPRFHTTLSARLSARILSPLIVYPWHVWSSLPIWLQYQIATQWGLTLSQIQQLIYNNKYELARSSSINRFSFCDSSRSYHFNLAL
jgi:tRNA(Ile)-lysidine synthetase-like protein